MTIITAVRTHDAPLAADGLVVAADLPAGEYLVRHEDGRLRIVHAPAADSSKRLTRAELEEANVAALKRVVAAARGRA